MTAPYRDLPLPDRVERLEAEVARLAAEPRAATDEVCKERQRCADHLASLIRVLRDTSNGDDADSHVYRWCQTLSIALQVLFRCIGCGRMLFAIILGAEIPIDEPEDRPCAWCGEVFRFVECVGISESAT